MNNTQKKMIEKEEKEFRVSDPDLIEESIEGKRETKVARSVLSNASDFVPLSMSGRSHRPSYGTIAIMESITVLDLQKMTDLFYEKAFQDETLDKFIQSHDDPHGSRFAKWIHQKLSGSTIWDEDRAERLRKRKMVTLADGGYKHLVHDRSSAHVAAWHSSKRPSRETGRHFKLDECRAWMRIHFWAMRESRIMEKSPAFGDYYVRFIGHFIRVYESKAPLFARESYRWSASPSNIERYIHQDGRKMKDVIGVDFQRAVSELPPSEANDTEWPYNLRPTSTASDEDESLVSPFIAFD